MKKAPLFSPFFRFSLCLAIFVAATSPSYAAMSFCNRTNNAVEAALGYRTNAEEAADNFVSEGWWRIEPGQCARVYGQPLTQRFYFYYAHALTQSTPDTPPTIWAGKYVFCTDDKAFKIDGDNDCTTRNYQATGFQELDLGTNVRDYTLDFKETAGK